MIPPRLADALLGILLPPGYRGDSIRGDLFEEYVDRLDHGPGKAAAWYWVQALRIGLRYTWERFAGLFRRTVAGRRAPRIENPTGHLMESRVGRGVGNPVGSRMGDRLGNKGAPNQVGGGGRKGGRPSVSSLIRDLAHDLRFGLRGLVREPAWALSTLGTLGLAIGATSAIFAVVYGVLIRPLPYPDSDRLVILEFAPSNRAIREAAASWDEYMREHFRHSISFPGYQSLRSSLVTPGPEGAIQGDDAFQDKNDMVREEGAVHEVSSPLQELGAFDDDWTYNVSFGPDAGTERLSGTLVSASLLRTLGVPPLVGRWPSEEEDLPGARGAVVLSHELWQNRLGGRGDLEGMTVDVDGVPYTLAGVMPPGFAFPSETNQVWISLSHATRDAGSTNYEIVGRLRQRVARDQADSRLASRRVVFPRNEDLEWEVRPGVASLHGYLVGDVRPALLLLFGAVGTLLLIACVNVVNLMLTRATKKEQEHTVRAALGASPGRLARLFLTESVLVSAVGAVLGVGLAWAILAILPGLVPAALPRQGAVRLDGVVLAFTLGSALIVGLAVGVAPAAQAARLRFVTRLVSGIRWASRDSREGRLRDALVVVQLGLALVLLVSGALLVRSFAGMLGEETGFDPSSVLTFETSLPRSDYPEAEDRRQFYNELHTRLKALPGVRDAGMTIYLPAGGQFHWGEVEIEGHVPVSTEEMLVEQKEVSPGYFSTLGMQLLEGRVFQGDDVWSEAREAVVTEKFVRQYLSGASPLGRRVNTGVGDEEEDEWWTIVGVVADVRYRGSQRDVPTMFFPYHAYRGGMDVVLKAEGYSASLGLAVQRVLAEMDADVTLFNLMPLEARLGRGVAGPRFQALLVASFGLLSLLLSVVGIYGVMAYAVARRTREMGIRRALGAESGRIVGRVAFQGLRLTVLGIALGMLVVFPLTGLLEGYLYQLEPHDPATLGLATGILAVASMTACLLPALRAARVDPLLALRAD